MSLISPKFMFCPAFDRRSALLSAVLLLAAPAALRADAPGSATPIALPVRAVTLFSSGVSYTLREGAVTGDAQVPLTFRTTQINDILKSLVLLDENGTVRPAVYAAKDPIGRALQSFAVDVSQPTDRVALLNRLKGAAVSVSAGGTVLGPSTATEKVMIEGQIVGVDRENPVNDGTTAEVLSILGDAGLQTVRLSEVRAIRFLDTRVNEEFKAALGLLAAGSDDKRRQVTLRFDGVGKRNVRVGYISEAPLWKISYRLLIGGPENKNDGKPYLQGWALVENTTDEDWTNVRLSLVSGRPVSFIQDLYQPLYLPRPVVPPDVVASPYPQVAEANIEVNNAAQNAPLRGAGYAGSVGAIRRSLGDNNQIMEQSIPAMVSRSANSDAAQQLYYSKSIVSAATGQRAGELFQYNIDAPVTLPRQQAAMIPVVAQNISGDKVSVYNADTDPRYPMNAFRIQNSTPLHLKGGPITIFDSGVYAGDARMEDVPPGDSRLVTYAVDLSVQGERQGPTGSGLETAFALRRGLLVISHRERLETVYTLKNKAEQPRLVIVEHPFNVGCRLIQPEKASSRTETHYRFEVPVAPGKSEKLTVVTEEPISQTVGLLDTDAKSLELYTARKDVSDRVKAALREVLARRRKVQELQSQAASAEAEVTTINTDQDRIRKNMEQLDHTSALYKRYVGQLDAQETRIQALRSEANRLRSASAEADRDVRAYIDGLDIAS
jgi:hypothetical protein